MPLQHVYVIPIVWDPEKYKKKLQTGFCRDSYAFSELFEPGCPGFGALAAVVGSLVSGNAVPDIGGSVGISVHLAVRSPSRVQGELRDKLSRRERRDNSHVAVERPQFVQVVSKTTPENQKDDSSECSVGAVVKRT